MTYREAARKLRSLGCQELPRRGSGSHRKWYNPDSDRVAPLPDWGSKDINICEDHQSLSPEEDDAQTTTGRRTRKTFLGVG
jgi:predicted RNA binding protein YcfA (HicA-like mRNA interferase family)